MSQGAGGGPFLLDIVARHYSITDIMYALMVVSGGLILLGWGIRFFRTIVGLAGFSATAVLAFVVLANIDERVGLGRWSKEIMLAGSVVAGMMGAALGLWIWMLALGAVGALGGLAGALWALSWRPNLLGAETGAAAVRRPLFIGGLVLAGAVLALVYEKAIIVAGTAAAGAVAVCSGMDVFVQSGFNDTLRKLLVNRELRHSAAEDPKAAAMLVVAAGLFAIGAVFQYRVSGREKRRKAWSQVDD